MATRDLFHTEPAAGEESPLHGQDSQENRENPERMVPGHLPTAKFKPSGIKSPQRASRLLQIPGRRNASYPDRLLASVCVIVPTLNAAQYWSRFEPMLLAQGLTHSQVLIVDSSSSDDTVELARSSGFRVESIARQDFNHGGTRQWATRLFPDAEIFIFLTQDAILASADALQRLVDVFKNPAVGAAYGRQLPRLEAGPIETHARLFNYPAVSRVCTLADRQELGFKTIFFSNSFAAYRRRAFEEAGGFPMRTILGEDTMVAANMLLRGWKVAYQAEACVYHSHNFTAKQEFQRYFDIGVLHTRETWLRQEFGSTGGEGKRFVLSELRHLARTAPLLIPSALLHTAAKAIGYKLGTREGRLPLSWKKRISMYSVFWQQGS